MERFSGLLLMLAGAAMSGYALFPGPHGGETNVAETAPASAVADQDAQSDAEAQLRVRTNYVPVETARSDDDGVRTFSPASPAFRERVRLDAADTAVLNASPKSGGWTTVVTASPKKSRVLSSQKPNDGATRFQLAEDLQRGLKRAGCYSGAINGRWTPAAKAAMLAFMERVNATLPADEPDYILLSLVDAHDTTVCSAACPSGQLRGASGQCIPQAVVAQADKKSERLERRRYANARSAGSAPRGRIASTTASSRPVAKPETVATVEPEKLPWLNGTDRQTATGDAPRSAPFPGRMGIGGPVTGTLPAGSAASRSSGWQRVPIGNGNGADDGNVAALDAGTALNVAALAPDGTPVDASAVGTGTQTIDKTRAAGWKAAKHRHHRASARSGRHYRSARYYRRRGEPRPGTMQYYVVRAMGGIY